VAAYRAYARRSWCREADELPQIKLPETQQLTVIQQWKEWLATIPDGKLPTNQKIEE
jgi:hypothetical protein